MSSLRHVTLSCQIYKIFFISASLSGQYLHLVIPTEARWTGYAHLVIPTGTPKGCGGEFYLLEYLLFVAENNYICHNRAIYVSRNSIIIHKIISI